MKERELRALGKCALCGEGLASKLPLFWRLRLQRFGIDAKAVGRQQGLTMLLGGCAELALAMGADEEMATPIGDEVTVAVCEPCAMQEETIYRLGLRG